MFFIEFLDITLETFEERVNTSPPNIFSELERWFSSITVYSVFPRIFYTPIFLLTSLEILSNLRRDQQLWCPNQDLLFISSKMEEQALLSPTPYKKEGLVKMILRTSKASSLAFRANVVIDPCLYLLYPTDLRLILSEVQAELNYIIEESAVARDLGEVVNQVPDAVLNPLVEFLTKELPHGPS